MPTIPQKNAIHHDKKGHKNKKAKKTHKSPSHIANPTSTHYAGNYAGTSGSGGYQLQTYMSIFNGGGDPVTALGVRGHGIRGASVDASMAQRYIEVEKAVLDSMELYTQAGRTCS
ncbi:hypothetical protein F5Y16DRAFT_399190 [Xylariaceae sp. FL0255]|nr:hypothetical protein F5Y16DRAFT_399190 [Xylariaceae sp. FL0255]